MKKISELKLGFSDAENYRRRENKELLNKVFIRNQSLDKLCEPAVCFLVGEKGTGKTAYSVYLSNNNYKNTVSATRYIRETEYQKFVSLKREKQLTISDDKDIWKVILYLLISQQVYEKGGYELVKRFRKLEAVKAAIDEYYNKAFSPEIIQALHFVQESKIAAELMAKHAKAAGEETDTLSFSESRFQLNLAYIQRHFESALAQARIGSNHILFIDGIDIRPSSISYPEYLECIKGLANAVWEINNDFFPTIKGGKGRLRAVLLIRPDIFNSLGLQNQNTKIRDNSVFLDWRTEYLNHRQSDLFRVVDHLLSSQQVEALESGQAWDYYFPWNAQNIREQYAAPTSFLAFLRWSYYRPRDILTMLGILQQLVTERRGEDTQFRYVDFEDPTFRSRYSDYLLGEIKDHLTFYYGSTDYENFLQFFVFLKGKRKFDHSDYLYAFKRFRKAIGLEDSAVPRFMSNPAAFLQFLYDLNIICYVERPSNDKPYFRWCFRERSFANISPKVMEGVEYEIFYGLHKALNVGQEIE